MTRQSAPRLPGNIQTFSRSASAPHGHRRLAVAAALAAAAFAWSASARAGLVAPDGQALAGSYGTVTTQNWAGYAVTASSGQAFTDVSASWTVPSATAAPDATSSYSAFWVGLDGLKSSSVEQIGISADVSNAIPQYYAWYEMYPDPAYLITTGSRHSQTAAPVIPGDAISAEVKYTSATQLFTLSMSDVTQNWTFAIDLAVPTGTTAPRSSAEWIAEAPSSSQTSSVLPLANFASVTFTAASATLDGTQTGGISTFSYSAINLVPKSGLGAVASSLTGGNSFTVSVVPEPASLGLAGLASLGLLARRRRA